MLSYWIWILNFHSQKQCSSCKYAQTYRTSRHMHLSNAFLEFSSNDIKRICRNRGLHLHQLNSTERWVVWNLYLHKFHKPVGEPPHAHLHGTHKGIHEAPVQTGLSLDCPMSSWTHWWKACGVRVGVSRTVSQKCLSSHDRWEWHDTCLRLAFTERAFWHMRVRV